MMLRFLALLCAAILSFSLTAQSPFKPNIEEATVQPPISVETLDFDLGQTSPALPSATSHLREAPFDPTRIKPIHLPGTAGVRVSTDPDNGQVFALRGRPKSLKDSPADKSDAYAYLAAVAKELGIDDIHNELTISTINGKLHARITQKYRGIPVWPADARLHATEGKGFDFFLGRLTPTPKEVDIVPTITEAMARTQVQGKFTEQWVELSEKELAWTSGPQLSAELIIYAPTGKSPRLAYRVDARPNLLEHTTIYLDAHSGETLDEYSHICGFAAKHNLPPTEELPVMDGPETTTVQDLYDRNVTLNTYSLQDTFYLLDGSRPMFSTAGGNLNGFILTYDGLGGTPQRDNFNPGIPISRNNRDWPKVAASVHANAGKSYQYFLDKFQRNSIDGIGGNVYSFMNINETDGTEMDNAFWNGRALFYGNGKDAFRRLPRGLDVAGHEMAHGVIQSSADLIYQEQPGAMNESFADIFGYLVEGEAGDYRIGEDVVNTGVFTSGAMRNLRNPNNNASGPNDFRWQPAHMDEYRNLPVNADNDNGGVHINSGIPNRAFYLFSSNPAVGDARAEKVYYVALTEFLTRSSRFADLRIAVVQAAQREFGATVAQAAEAAFDGVGIGGEAGDYTVDIEENEGDRFLLLANSAETALFLAQEDGTILNNPLEEVTIKSRPSVTDDGSAAVFVDGENKLRIYDFNAGELRFIEGEPGTNWRNIAVSKDGSRVAVTTTANDNTVLIFDFVSGTGRNMTLINPTTANGISTGDVLYSDAMEWDPRGEFLMYDALSRLDDGLEFWDIGFLKAWDTDSDDFGDGTVIKLFSNLPEDVSIGNPTFSKNSPYIIAFEEVDFSTNTFKIIGANIETGKSAMIFENDVINYPNYSIDDDLMVFDAQNTSGDPILATIPIASDKISAGGNPAGLIGGGHWGTFFANGQRDLDTGLEGPIVEDEMLRVYPTLTDDLVTIERATPGKDLPIQLMDVSGRLVATFKGLGLRQEISLGQQAGGVYFLAIPTDGGTVVRRVVVR